MKIVKLDRSYTRNLKKQMEIMEKANNKVVEVNANVLHESKGDDDPHQSPEEHSGDCD